MTAAAFDDWLARGRVHLGEGRPTDAIPCFRRAAREDPRSPVPHFHLGEVLWQLGLADDAVRAWQASADLDKTFSPPRLALAEVALTRGDFEVAADNAAQASTLAPGRHARASHRDCGACGGGCCRRRGSVGRIRRATGCRSEPAARRAGRVGGARRRDSAGRCNACVHAAGRRSAAPFVAGHVRERRRARRAFRADLLHARCVAAPGNGAAALARPHGGHAPAPRVADAGARSRELRRGPAGARGRRARAVFPSFAARAVQRRRGAHASRDRRPCFPRCPDVGAARRRRSRHGEDRCRTRLRRPRRRRGIDCPRGATCSCCDLRGVSSRWKRARRCTPRRSWMPRSPTRRLSSTS